MTMRKIEMILPINDTKQGNQVVSGRDLYEFLGAKADFPTWFKRMLKYGFTKDTDFIVIPKIVEDDTGFGGHRRVKDYAMTLDMAKEVAMVQRTDKGKQARQYFIQTEKEYKAKREEELSKHMLPMTNEEKIRAMAQESLETKETVKKNTADIKQLKDTFPISNSQQQELNQLEHAIVINFLGGKDSNAYENLKGKAFAQCWRDFKRHFSIPRYNELPKVKFEQGKQYLRMWAPDTDLRIKIKEANGQLSMV